MKKTIASALMIFYSAIFIGQVTNEGKPASWEEEFLKSSKKNISEIQMPLFNLKKIRAEDKVNDSDRSKPYRFGHEFKVDVDVKKDGTLDILPNGDHLYRLGIYSDGAKTLNFVFDKYSIPIGATIYFYNDDKTDLLGAYTNVFNSADEMLGTWMVSGEKVWIEYREPKSVIGQGKLNIGRVIHGYRSVTDVETQQKALNDSGDCNRDVNCWVGKDFNNLKNKLKHSVALVIMNGSTCSGTLINNTKNDGTPFLLTANHCNTGSESTWAFRFNWVSPKTSCGTTANSTNGSMKQTTSGAKRLASNSNSDFKLLRLTGGLGNWRLEFAGWDRSGKRPTGYTVGIHHPWGDVMKVCRDNARPKYSTFDLNGDGKAVLKAWKIDDWDLGVTEPGSSGSALFDSTGRIIGQLAGGSAACYGTNDNGLDDNYGRFSVSWNSGNTNGTRLRNWLDPKGTGAKTLNSFSKWVKKDVNSNSVVEEENNKLVDDIAKIYPNPSNGIINMINNSGDILRYTLFNVMGQEIGRGELIENSIVLDMTSYVDGIYFVSITNTLNNKIFTKKIVINR
ncbi:T9SS type A sorting domain-containing protein [Aquimarina latercula]|uniref:T9SS type A sorting domain-containing protein n=1 Tax=Aquimarina latercula TaxID=987 RepID=UPI0003F6DA47|nr:T9SS type A sorting domain-containing protein [Aquimarina latercula]